MSWWAFGWRTLCVALAVFATNFPSRFYWTGGAFLRWDWLFYLVGGVCLIKKERPLLGGFFLGYSTLLRVFPLFIFFGPILVIIRQLWGKVGEWPKPAPAAGAATSAPGPGAERRAAAAPVVAAGAVGVVAGARRARRSALRPDPRRGRAGGGDPGAGQPGHQQRHRGLPRVRLQHREAQGDAAHQLHGPAHRRRLQPVRGGAGHEGRSAGGSLGPLEAPEAGTFHAREPLYFFFAACFVVLLCLALRDAEPWVACALGAMMIAVGVELTCYYYSFLFALALLYHKRREAGAILLGVTAMTGFIDWSPTRYLPDVKPWMNFKISQWLDEQYMMMSVVTLLGFVWILYRFAYVRPIEASPVAAAAAVAGAGDASRPRRPSTGASPRGAAAATTSRRRRRSPRARRR